MSALLAILMAMSTPPAFPQAVQKRQALLPQELALLAA